MPTVTVSSLIDASPAELWRLLTGLAGRAAWLSTVDEVELLTSAPPELLTSAPPTGCALPPGTAWRERRTESDGSRWTEEFLVVESVWPGRLVLASPGIGVDYRITWTLTPGRWRRRPGPGPGPADCTLVTVEQEAIPTARYGRLLALLLGGLAARTGTGAFRADLADLAAVVGGVAGLRRREHTRPEPQRADRRWAHRSPAGRARPAPHHQPGWAL